ncbi:MAG: FliH/SctL family protein [Burkholderiaceae bacterium]
MNSSKPAGTPYHRFIPREELQGFASWQPHTFGGGAGSADAARDAPRTPKDWQAAVDAARQAGYQDGYRDGLVALEGFKRGVLQDNAAQFGALLQRFDAQLDALEQEMAQSLARVATAIARQVVRDELQVDPQRVARVTREAVNAVLMSARHIVVQVHPEDLALVEQGAAEVIAARGARIVPDAGVERGGCRVLSDVGTIDARISARWQQASSGLGSELPWTMDDGEAAT